MKRTLFFLLTFILLCSSKCKEDPLPAPNPTTEEPTDEISCLINGVEWKTGPPFLLSKPKTDITIQKTFNGYYLSLHAHKTDDKGTLKEIIDFSCPYDTTKLGIYQINYSPYIYTDDNTKSVDYELDTLLKRNLIITSINTQKQFIKGEFNYRAINRKEKDTINITNGKFYCRYQFFK